MLRTLAVLSALSLGSAMFAGANTIGAGQSNTPDPLNPNGIQLIQTTGTLTALYAGTTTVDYTVNYTAGVYQDMSSQVCPNCLDFYYIFTNNGPGVNERFTASNFTGSVVDAGYNASQGGQAPVSVDRSSDGSVVGFNYNGGNSLNSGSSTSILVIETDATSYTTGSFTIQDGATVDGVGFAPAAAAATPEPASLALFGTGLLGVVGAARRRFRI